MFVLESVLAVVAVLVIVPLWAAAFAIRAVWRSITWLTDAQTRISEIEREKLGKLSRMSEGAAPDALITRLSTLETGFESQKMLVSDAVERVTALGNRVAARQRRAAADVLDDDEPESGPTPEQARALAKLLAGNGEAPITPAAPAPGLSLKERAKAHRAQRGG